MTQSSVALPILAHRELNVLTTLPPRPTVEIAEYTRDGRLLCIEPISGAWAVGDPASRCTIHEQLEAQRRDWLVAPVADEVAAPPHAVTVPLKNKHCNLRCDYCFAESEGEGGYPPVELMLRFLQMVEELHPQRLRIFVFHGGEPLVDWKTVESVILRHRDESCCHDGQTKFALVTNGTLVTPAIARRLAELRVEVCVSIDGPAEVHDRYRRYLLGRGSFARVRQGLDRLRDEGIQPNTLSTVADPDDLELSFRFFRDEQLSPMFLRPLRWQGRAIPLLRQLVADEGEQGYHRRFAHALLRVADEVAIHNRGSLKKVVEYGLAVRVSNLVRRDRPYMCLRSPCGAVSGHKLGLDGHGNIFPCDTMVEFPELSVAHVADVADANQLRQRLASATVCRCLKQRRVEHIPKCSTCHVQRFCGGECTAASYARFASLHREGDRCDLEQLLFVELLWRIADDVSFLEAVCPGTLRAETHAWSDVAAAIE